MAELTITQAAKQWNVTRNQLYRYMERGKLSTRTDATGRTMIDTSELIRVLGEPKSKEQKQNIEPVNTSSVLVDGMKKQIEMLERELRDAKEREKLVTQQVTASLDLIANLTQRLEHHPKETSEIETKTDGSSWRFWRK